MTQLDLFGCYIRGRQAKTSDLDMLVEFVSEARFCLLKFCELENGLNGILRLKVDLVMKTGLEPSIGERIL